VKSFTAPGVKPDELLAPHPSPSRCGRPASRRRAVGERPGAVYYFKNDGIGTDWTFNNGSWQPNREAGDRGSVAPSAVRWPRGAGRPPLARPIRTLARQALVHPESAERWHLVRGLRFRPPASKWLAEFGAWRVHRSALHALHGQCTGRFLGEFQNPGIYTSITWVDRPRARVRPHRRRDTARFGESFSVSTDWLAIGEPTIARDRIRPTARDRDVQQPALNASV